MADQDFDGKIAIVTGAASGIGAATVRLLARGGARVLAVDMNADGLEALAAECDGRVLAHVAQLAERAEVEAMVAAAVARLGALDILINNAGIGGLSRLGDLDPEQWRNVMTINLDAVFLGMRAALPFLLERRGCVVNTASISGIAADYGFAAYNASKAAVIAVTRAAALDYGPQGVRVNAVSPGFIETPMVAMLPPALVAGYREAAPLRRSGRAEEVAAAIGFLASDRASFITGHNLVVDGGMTAHTGAPNVLEIFARYANG